MAVNATKKLSDVVRLDQDSGELDVKTGRVLVCLIGNAPFISHAMSISARAKLLTGGEPRGSRTERTTKLRHDPLKEYQESMYTTLEKESPTFVTYPANALKKAMIVASKYLEGVSPTDFSRMVYVVGKTIPIYGVPQLLLTEVVNSGFPKVKDIRSRAHFDHWASEVRIEYDEQYITKSNLGNIILKAGRVAGLGDSRPEKGGDFGRFEIVVAGHPRWEEFNELRETAGHRAQLAAYDDPSFADRRTEETWHEFQRMAVQRERSVTKPQIIAVRKARRDISDGNSAPKFSGNGTSRVRL